MACWRCRSSRALAAVLCLAGPATPFLAPRAAATAMLATLRDAASPRSRGHLAADSLDGAGIYESLACFSQHSEKCVVVKYGGHAMSDERAAESFAQDIVLMQRLGVRPVVVHGGGPQIGDMLKRLNTTSTFIDGLRVTDAATVQVSEMVLCGKINKQIAAAISRLGGHALGLSGKDDSLIVAEKLVKFTEVDGVTEVVDLGFVGEPVDVNSKLLNDILDNGRIPVVAPIAAGRNGETFSVNADTAAGAVAEALGASRLLLLTDVTGVLDADMKLIHRITPTSASDLVKEGIIKGGMIPKLQTAVQAVERGCGGAAIVDGRIDHAVLEELFSESGAGTLVVADDASDES